VAQWGEYATVPLAWLFLGWIDAASSRSAQEVTVS
jgi:hypothetical protein